MTTKNEQPKVNNEIAWRDELTAHLVDIGTAHLVDIGASLIGSESWSWSIRGFGYRNGHPDDAILHITVNLRMVAEKMIVRAERACVDVLVFSKVSRTEQHRIVAHLSERQFREYLGRAAKWLMKTEHVLTEFALAIALIDGETVRTLDRKTSPGEPNRWLDPRELRDWLTNLYSAFLKKEMVSLRPPRGRRDQTDEDLRLFIRVVKLRAQLKAEGVTQPDREASRRARAEFKISTYENYKQRLSKGRATAGKLGII